MPPSPAPRDDDADSAQAEARDINARIAAQVRELRGRHGLSLEALAERSGVSRSMISLIERGQSSATAVVLERLAAGLGVPLAALFDAPRAEPSPVARRAAQVAWRDPGSGYERRNLTPPGLSLPLQLVEVDFPGGAKVTYDSPPRRDAHQQVWMIDGTMEITSGTATHRLAAGDCLAMWLDGPTSFHNPTRRRARYLVAITSGVRPAAL